MDYLSSVMSEQAHGDPFDLADPPPRRKLEKNSHNTQDEEVGTAAETVQGAPGPKILLRAKLVANTTVEQDRAVARSEARAPADRSRRARADRHHPEFADRDRNARPLRGLQSSVGRAFRAFGGEHRPSASRHRADATHALAQRTNTCRTGLPAVTT